jgi:hypothetical protein
VIVAIAAACGGSGKVEPPAVSNVKQPAVGELETGDETIEWKLLQQAAADPDGLGTLASYYGQRQAWDEYSAVRSVMLVRAESSSHPPKLGPGPAPGGPFPRIGLPSSTPKPRTVLSRWLNRNELPELYEPKEITLRELEAILHQAMTVGDPNDPHDKVQLELADLLCVQLRWEEAAAIYRALNPTLDNGRVGERYADVRRILGR